jgi:hypothetical protein
VSEALQLRQEFEENFTCTLHDLRKELEHTSLKHLHENLGCNDLLSP